MSIPDDLVAFGRLRCLRVTYDWLEARSTLSTSYVLVRVGFLLQSSLVVWDRDNVGLNVRMFTCCNLYGSLNLVLTITTATLIRYRRNRRLCKNQSSITTRELCTISNYTLWRCIELFFRSFSAVTPPVCPCYWSRVQSSLSSYWVSRGSSKSKS